MSWSDEDFSEAETAGKKTLTSDRSKESPEVQRELANVDEKLQTLEDYDPSTNEIDPVTGDVNSDVGPLKSTYQDVLAMLAGGVAYRPATLVAEPVVKAAAQLAGKAGLPKALQKIAQWVLPRSAGGAVSGGTEEAIAGRDPIEGAKSGAFLGPVIEGGLHVAGKTAGAISDISGGAETAVSKRVRDLFPDEGGRRQAAIHALRNTPPTGVVGEIPTVGSLATPELPEFASLEAMYRRRPGASRFSEIDAANKHARWNMFGPYSKFGRKGRAQQGGKVPMSASEQIRYDRTKPMFDRAGFDRIPVDTDVLTVLQGEDVAKAVRAGRRRFADASRNAKLEKKNFPSPARVDLDGKLRNMSVAELDMIRDEISKYADSAFRQGDTALGTNLADFRKNLGERMEKTSWQYRQARDRYRELSKNVNSSHAMAELQDRLVDPFGIETPNNYGDAMRNQENVLTASASGKPRFQQFEQVLSKDQMAVIKAVNESLRRQQVARELPRSEGVVGNNKTTLESIEEKIPPIFDKYATASKRALKVAGAKLSDEQERLLGDAVADPEKMAKLLEQIPPSERSIVVKALRKSRRPVAAFESSNMTQQNLDDDYEE